MGMPPKHPYHGAQHEEQQPQPLQSRFSSLDVHEEGEEAREGRYTEGRRHGRTNPQKQRKAGEEQQEQPHLWIYKPMLLILDVADEWREQNQEGCH